MIKMSNIVSKNKEGYGYRYTDISEIHRYLEENNMSYYQYIDRIDGDDYIMTVKIVDGKEQPAIRGSRVVQATLQGIKNPAQEQGSALTYARRYSLLMAFGLATDDDDAQSLSRPVIGSKEEAEEYVITFGKYTGKKMKELPQNYLEWLLENSKDETIKTCADYLIEHLTNEEAQERMMLLQELSGIMNEKGIDREKLYKHYKVSSNAELTSEQLRDAIERLNK
jgi:hypothetical protein